MLSKCLKHEFRATYALVLTILLAVVLFSGVTALTSHFLYTPNPPVVLELIAVFARLIFNLVVGAASIGITLVCVLRYWRSFHSDEGYLTMTMPVSTHTHIFSKLIVAEVWGLLAVIVFIVASFVSDVGIWQEFFYVAEEAEIATEVVTDEEVRQVFLFLLLGLLAIVISPAANMLMIYAAISLGHSFQKYKKLLSVVFYFVFNQVIGVLYFVPILVLLVNAIEDPNIPGFYNFHYFPIVNIIFSL